MRQREIYKHFTHGQRGKMGRKTPAHFTDGFTDDFFPSVIKIMGGKILPHFTDGKC